MRPQGLTIKIGVKQGQMALIWNGLLLGPLWSLTRRTHHFGRQCPLSLGGQSQQPDYFTAERFNLIVLWSQLQSSARLKISFCAVPAGLSRVSSLFKSVVRQAPSKMCGQTHIGWIHDYCGSQTIDCSLLYPLLNPWGNCAF